MKQIRQQTSTCRVHGATSATSPLPGILTLVAVLASIGYCSLTPRLADAAVELVKKGEDGENGESTLLWSNATPGHNAEPVSLTQKTPVRENSPVLMKVGSQGGAGGSVYTKGVAHNVPGKPGGHGGSVNLVVAESADLSATLSNTPLDNPVIQIFSRGGTGGFGYRSWLESEGGISRGGDGGPVSVNLASAVTVSTSAATRDKSVPVISIVSEGGAAGVSKTGIPGNDGTNEDRVDIDRGNGRQGRQGRPGYGAQYRHDQHFRQ